MFHHILVDYPDILYQYSLLDHMEAYSWFISCHMIQSIHESMYKPYFVRSTLLLRNDILVVIPGEIFIPEFSGNGTEYGL